MRIQDQSQSIESMDFSSKVDTKSIRNNKSTQVENQVILKGNLNQVVDSINEVLEINHSNLKFVFHEGLEQYFVQLINSETEEIVKELPPKKLLDAFYEMQKIVGMIVDEKI